MKKRKTVFLVLIALLFADCSAPVKPDGVADDPGMRSDAWAFAGYGGGGAMFFPAVSPHDAQLALVACDMTGSYVTYNGGESWRMFNLRGPVDYFVFDPVDPNTIYAHSIALFKSTNRGRTWSILYPHPSEVVSVVSKGDHATEVIVTRDSTRRNVHAFAIDPADPGRLYAAIAIDGVNALYISTDGGDQWTKETDLDEEAQNIFVIPSSPVDDRSIVVTTGSGVTKKADGKWQTNPGPSGVKRLTRFAGGFDQESGELTLYAISGKSYFNPEGDVSGIHFSPDGGATWENRQAGILAWAAEDAAVPEYRAIATSTAHPNVVYVSYNDLRTAGDTTCMGVARSDDYGKTWQLVWKDMTFPGGHKVDEHYESGWINERFGPGWGENPFSLGVSPVDPRICYATDFGRTTKTEDGGQTWQQVYTQKNPRGDGWRTRGLEVTTSYAVVFDPFDMDHVFIANTDVGLMRSTDGGSHWSSATQANGIPRPWINSTYWLAFDPEVRGKAWAAMSGTHDLPRPKMFRRNGTRGYRGGIVMTEDGGDTWTPVSADIGDAAMTHVLIDEISSAEQRTLYACAFGKGVYKSVDGGRSWQSKNNGITGDEPFAWRITKRRSDNTLFLVVCRRSEDGSIGDAGDGALYRSRDGAETWTRMTLPEGVNGPMSLVVDPERSGWMLLSAWGRRTPGKFSPDTGGGIFLSRDDGVSWTPVLTHDQHIHDITYDHRNGVYYACGFNGSAYRSDDGGAHWQRLGGYNFKWGKRVDPDLRDSSKIFVITFGGGVWYGPAEGDRNAVEDIKPPLPRIETFRNKSK